MVHCAARESLYIEGEFRQPSQTTVVYEAATGEPLGQAASATPADVDAAVAAAHGPHAQAWRSQPAAQRSEALLRFATALEARAEQTAMLVSRENGMPIALSRVVNGIFPAMLTRYYAKLAIAAGAEEIRPSLIGHTIVRREPVGVVAAIAPWNYPQALAIMKIAPALAAGCPVVFKAAPETGLDAVVFAEAAEEADIPAGVLNVLAGDAAAGAHLVAHPGIDKVAFTGSTDAGRRIGEVCGRLLRPVTLELGGKSAAIILDDADLATTLDGLRAASFVNNGQTCHACTRILVPRSRYSEVVDALADLAARLVVGDPLDEATEIGPLVSERQRRRVLDYIDLGLADGATLVAGGGVPADRPEGWFVAPTVLAGVDNSQRIAQEEIFGPVLVVIAYDDDAEAIAMANDSPFGLAGTVWSPDVDRATEIARAIHTGTVGVNGYELDLRSPFGGVKASGLGRELGPEGLQAYWTLKSIYRVGPHDD
jgi:acyl-CoA reductase-like NAD-dependent aldehyde dehydrogenase